MSWDCWKFPRHPVAAEIMKLRGRNTILLYYNYRVDTKLGKYVCVINMFPCACILFVAQLDKYCLPTITT